MEDLNGIETNYLEQIEKLKKQMESMVPGEEYNKVLAEHKKLTDDYINKRTAPAPQQTHVTTAEDVEMLAKQLASCKKEVTNREYIEIALKHRQAVLDVYDKDPFGHNGQKSAEAAEAAAFFTGLLEESNSPMQFRLLMEERVKDDPVVVQKVRAAKAEADTNKKKK